MEQLYKETGARGESRRRSFSATDWPDGKKLVRVEKNDVPIYGTPDLNAPKLDVLGVASTGEFFAFVDQNSLFSLMNPLSRVPDQSGLWYKIAQLDGKQGWVFAQPVGHQEPPLAQCFITNNGQLAASRIGSPQGPTTGGSEAMDNARGRGAKAGEEDGKRLGYAAGFADASKAAANRSYSEAIGRAYDSGHYKQLDSFTYLVIVGGFLFGFSFQYAGMSIIRRCGLRDIDWIVLGRRESEFALNNPSLLSTARKHDETGGRKGSLIRFFLLFVLLIGCENQENEVYKQAYNSRYKAAEQAGHQAGEASGFKIGADKGEAAAKAAAENGSAWQLYSDLARDWLILGVVAGLLSQYALLLACRLSHRLQKRLSAYFCGDYRALVMESSKSNPYFQLTVAFVPAMKISTAHSIFQELNEIKASTEKILATGKLHAAEIAARLVADSRLKDVENIAVALRVHFAMQELDEILSEAQAKAANG